MTKEEITEMIASIGLPYAYYSFPEKEAPELPYVIYNYPNSDNFGADNRVYARIDALDIELYTANKSPEREAQVESVLNGAGLFWNKTETYINTEHMYEVLYEMEVLINDNSE